MFIFLGDNGTPKDIVSNFKRGIVTGDKGQTTTYGTHVPFIVTWPRHIPAGRITSQLVDLTDFMPTLSDPTSSAISADIGVIDGKSFYPVISGSNLSSRDYVFNHFQPFLDGNSKATRYVQDSVYKQYESGKFYDMSIDIKELSPILKYQMTTEEKAKQNYFQQIMGLMHN
ncbi:hypothetical protein BH10BAC2_BH10BAC2_18910 [soil metagenome]